MLGPAGGAEPSVTVFRVVLALHIAAGAAGLVLGPIAMRARKEPGLHTRAGETYHWVMLAVCLTASLLAVLEWKRVRWFLPVAAGSYTFALLGYTAAKRRWQGWLKAHIAGQGASYIAMTTALLVVNWETLNGHARHLLADALGAADRGGVADRRLGDLPGQDRETPEAIRGGSLSVQGAAASKAAAARSTAASCLRRPTI